MPVYVEMVKDKKTGKKIEKKVNDKKQYYIRTYIKDKDGKAKQITKHNKNWLGRDGYIEASQVDAKLSKQIIQQNNIKIYDLAEEYLNEVLKTKKRSTYEKHRNNYCIHIKPLFMNKKVSDITNKDVLEWKSKINEEKIALKTKQGIYITFGAIIKHGCKYYNIEKNPFCIVGNFTAKKGEKKKQINVMSEKQFQQFLLYEKDDLYKQIFKILFYTGMRRGELLALTWDDIDFENCKIIISKSFNPKVKSENTTPKTDKSNRTIKMLDIVKESFLFLKKKELKKPTSFVTLTTLKRHCDNNANKINISDFRIHDFRHSFATMCIDKCIPINIISEYLGHENVSTTMNIYGHLYSNSQDKLITMLSENQRKQDQKQDQRN